MPRTGGGLQTAAAAPILPSARRRLKPPSTHGGGYRGGRPVFCRSTRSKKPHTSQLPRMGSCSAQIPPFPPYINIPHNCPCSPEGRRTQSRCLRHRLEPPQIIPSAHLATLLPYNPPCCQLCWQHPHTSTHNASHKSSLLPTNQPKSSHGGGYRGVRPVLCRG